VHLLVRATEIDVLVLGYWCNSKSQRIAVV